MSDEKLEEGLRAFYDQMDERLKDLSPAEKQQYLEGLVHAFDAMTRYANFGDLTPVEQQKFIGSAKSWAYSKTYHLGLDPETRMRHLIESDGEGTAKAFYFAAKIQMEMDFPLSIDEIMEFRNILAVYNIEQRKGDHDRIEGAGYSELTE